MSEYESLLKRAYELMPEKILHKKRFEPPKADILVEGRRTIIKNFREIANTLRRPEAHLSKYLSKELAAIADVAGTRLLLKSRIPPRIINQKLDAYIKQYVLCKECERPDTKMAEEMGVKMLKCTACGAKFAIREIR